MCPLGRPAGEDGTFLKGTIEQVPLPDTSVDIAISGCVINLAEDQGAVLHEAFRVLKPGGRFTFRQEHAGTPWPPHEDLDHVRGRPHVQPNFPIVVDTQPL